MINHAFGGWNAKRLPRREIASTSLERPLPALNHDISGYAAAMAGSGQFFRFPKGTVRHEQPLIGVVPDMPLLSPMRTFAAACEEFFPRHATNRFYEAKAGD